MPFHIILQKKFFRFNQLFQEVTTRAGSLTACFRHAFLTVVMILTQAASLQ
jgi:hypothetical protein